MRRRDPDYEAEWEVCEVHGSYKKNHPSADCPKCRDMGKTMPQKTQKTKLTLDDFEVLDLDYYTTKFGGRWVALSPVCKAPPRVPLPGPWMQVGWKAQIDSLDGASTWESKVYVQRGNALKALNRQLVAERF